jgi:hypothetical protein
LKPLLEFLLNGSFKIVGEVIGGMSDEEWTSRAYPKANVVGFTLWHCARTIDWAVNTVGGGGDEMAEQPQWRDVKPAGSFFGAGLTAKEADAVARAVSRDRTKAYLDGLRTQVVEWFRALPPDELNRIVDLKSAEAPRGDHLEAVVWPEIEDLNGIPLWQFLARPCGAHVRVHYGEVTAQLQALRATAVT